MLDLRIKIKVGLPESFKVGLYPHKITGSSHLNLIASRLISSPTKQYVANRDSTKTAFLINSVAVFLQTVIMLLTTIRFNDAWTVRTCNALSADEGFFALL